MILTTDLLTLVDRRSFESMWSRFRNTRTQPRIKKGKYISCFNTRHSFGSLTTVAYQFVPPVATGNGGGVEPGGVETGGIEGGGFEIGNITKSQIPKPRLENPNLVVANVGS